MYDLALLPSSYHQRSYREAFEVIFRTRQPDGLIWFTGNYTDNMFLAMKVCVDRLITYLAFVCLLPAEIRRNSVCLSFYLSVF